MLQGKRHSPLAGPYAFSLVELVIVVVIIGIIAAIAVPRLSKAGGRASAGGLAATLTNVRKVIDLYYAEHASFPGYNPSTSSPDGTWFVNQLTMYTDIHGNTNGNLGGQYIYGPYLREPFPVNPFNDLSNVYVKKEPLSPTPMAGSVGWVATLSTGDFEISATAEEINKLVAKGGSEASAIIAGGG